MCNIKTKRFRAIEVQIDSVGKQTFTLGDEETLRDAKRIVAIEAYRLADVSMSANARALVGDAIFEKSFLTISTKDTDQVHYRIPLTDLCRADNNGQLYEVDIPPIAPSKCEIFVATVAGLSAAESFLLGFHYEK
jgi:hypothetical protein